MKNGIVILIALAVVATGCGKSTDQTPQPALQTANNGINGNGGDQYFDTETNPADGLFGSDKSGLPPQNPTSQNPNFCWDQQNCIQGSGFAPVNPGFQVNAQLCACAPGQELVFNPDGFAACRTVVTTHSSGFVFDINFRPRRDRYEGHHGDDYYGDYGDYGDGHRGGKRHGRRYKRNRRNRFDFVFQAGTQQHVQDIDAGMCNTQAKMVCDPYISAGVDQCSAIAGNGAVRCVPVGGTDYGFCGVPSFF